MIDDTKGTIDHRPAPLVPPDVDLSGLQWMPFFGARVFRGEFYLQADDATYRACANLEWAAWQSLPAASLPNDDAALTRLADLGRDIEAFRRMKPIALLGFIECIDGRLINAERLALAVSEREFGEIAVQVLFGNVVVRAHDPALEGREKDGFVLLFT